jgi:hypothetical protein
MKRVKAPPSNPPELTELQRWVVDTLMEHHKDLGEIKGILKIATPVVLLLVSAILALEIR